METKNQKTKWIAGAAILLLLLSAGGNFILNRKANNLRAERDQTALKAEKELAEKLQVSKALSATKSDLEKYKGINADLDKLVLEKTAELDRSSIRIEKLLKENAGIPALKKELATLMQIKADFERQVNQLAAENAGLKKELASVKNEFNAYSSGLASKIEKAKNLKAYNMQVYSFKLRRNNKEVATSKARKTDRISVTFDLVENVFADAGKKEVRLKIVDERGVALLDEDEDVYASLEPGMAKDFSVGKEVYYNNNDLSLTLNFDYSKKLAKGTYVAEIFADGKLAGKKEFVLK